MSTDKGKGRRFKITGQVGEYLVAAELCRRGYIATTFSGNVPEFDILATDEKLKTTPIQVKTIQKGGSFQSSVDKWMNISISKKGEQIIRGHLALPNPSLIYIMVVLGDEYGKDEFFLLTKKQLQKIYTESHSNWLAKHNGIRPKKPDSFHPAIMPEDLKDYYNNWKILEKTNR